MRKPIRSITGAWTAHLWESTMQGNLFSPFVDTATRQPKLWQEGPPESERTCGHCGENMVRTPSGWYACPRGHGPLMAPEEGEK